MTTRPKPVLVLDLERLRELLCESDPETRQLAEAIGKNLNKAVEILNGLIVPYKKPPKEGARGDLATAPYQDQAGHWWTPAQGATRLSRRPKLWGRTEQLCVWLAVEIEVQLARKAEPGIGYKTAMQRFFRRNRNRPLRACTNLSGGPHLDIKTVDIALDNHRAGRALLRDAPSLDAKYQNILKNEIVRRLRLRNNQP